MFERLREAGLGSTPGTAAEVLHDGVRERISPNKLPVARWVEIIEASHAEGIRSTVTVMFGHVEEPWELAEHMRVVRELQERTGGFTEFVPLSFIPFHTLLGRTHGVEEISREENLKHTAAFRLALGKTIRNLQASWVKMGLDAATESLRWGVNDLGGTLMEESISRMAGSYHGVKLDPAGSRRGGAPRRPSGGRAHDAVRDPPAVRRCRSLRRERRPADRGSRRPSLFAGVEPLEVFVELLADIDMHTAPTEFYDRICEAICRLTTMRRAAIFMADAARRRVRAIGSYGIPFDQLSAIRPTLVNTPIAQRALLEDKVVVVSERIEEEVPPEYAQLLGITTLVCTPLSAGGYAYGVICADRGGGRFELSDGERHLLWTLGKTAALVAAARNVTRQQERTRALGERLDLAREIHESVLQRLFGVSLALGAEQPLDRAERERCRIEMQEALSDLRRALERPLAPLPPETGTTLAAELERVRKSPGFAVEVDWRGESTVPADIEPLAQSVLAEALRNIAKHADPSRVEVAVARDQDTFTLEVRNDGARGGEGDPGIGLRLAAFEALQQGGVVEFGPSDPGQWRVRLVVPLQQDGRDADVLEPEEF